MSENNETSMPVYNKELQGIARNLLTDVDVNDIGQEVVPCVLSVHVTDARFCEQRTRYGRRIPYLEIIGEVTDVFKDDDDIFSCGTKRLSLMEPQDVRVAYLLTDEEISKLVNLGLYHSDFAVPPDLIDNTIEIPWDITYTCVYETPITMVDINMPYNIETSTKRSGYSFEGVFGSCEVSRQRALQGNKSFDLTIDAVYSDDYDNITERSKYESIINRNDFEDHRTNDLFTDVKEEIAPTLPKTNEEKLMDNIKNEIMQTEENRVEMFKEANSPDNRRKTEMVLRTLREQKKRVRAEKRKADADAYGALTSDTARRRPDYSNFADGLTYEELKSFISNIQRKLDENNMTQEDKKKAYQEALLEFVFNADRAADNKALNEGNTNIAGMGAGESDNTSKMTSEEKAEYHQKKTSKVVRNVDTALDNKALNEGNADIAGMGAGSKPDVNLANSLRGLLGNKKSARPQISSQPLPNDLSEPVRPEAGDDEPEYL